MGRIKSTMVKKAARQIMDKEENAKFDEDFENNKKILRSLLPSKPIQNKVAGYITRLMKMQRMQKEKRTAPVQSAVNEEPQPEMQDVQ